MPEGIRVVVIDDHGLVAETLKATLSEQEGIIVVGLASSRQEGIDLVVSLIPEVVLVDFRLPNMTGADVIRVLSDRTPSCRVSC
jgi:DNA-binding NarL/FixJ family response regulator